MGWKLKARELIWATAQYLSYARPGSMLEVDVRLPVQGNNITQSSADRGFAHGHLRLFSQDGTLMAKSQSNSLGTAQRGAP
jgi:hypothetical protein